MVPTLSRGVAGTATLYGVKVHFSSFLLNMHLSILYKVILFYYFINTLL